MDLFLCGPSSTVGEKVLSGLNVEALEDALSYGTSFSKSTSARSKSPWKVNVFPLGDVSVSYSDSASIERSIPSADQRFSETPSILRRIVNTMLQKLSNKRLEASSLPRSSPFLNLYEPPLAHAVELHIRKPDALPKELQGM